MTDRDDARDKDVVPVSVRLGEVVPPDDPEDWTRPLTWVAALGMLAGPIAALGWFVAAPPSQAEVVMPATFVVAVALVAGAAATGATQIGAARAGTATLGAGLFAALLVVVLGVVMAGERQLGAATPTLAHSFAAAVGGTAGVAVASLTATMVARLRSWPVRFVPALLGGVVLAVLVTPLLLSPAPVAVPDAGRTTPAETCG